MPSRQTLPLALKDVGPCFACGRAFPNRRGVCAWPRRLLDGRITVLICSRCGAKDEEKLQRQMEAKIRELQLNEPAFNPPKKEVSDGSRNPD